MSKRTSILTIVHAGFLMLISKWESPRPIELEKKGIEKNLKTGDDHAFQQMNEYHFTQKSVAKDTLAFLRCKNGNRPIICRISMQMFCLLVKESKVGNE